VFEAMKKAGSIDSTKVRDTLQKLEYKGVLQTYKFSGTNQSEVVININEIKDAQVLMRSSIITR
jgi:hypothetical protein